MTVSAADRVDPARLRLDGSLRGMLPPAAAVDVLALMAEDGDCGVCRQPLGPAVPVTLTVQSTRESAQLLVVPNHAPCTPGGAVAVRTLAGPPPSTRSVALEVRPAALSMKTRWPALSRGRLVVVVINPSFDVQIGMVQAGRWSSALSRGYRADGLAVLTAGEAPGGKPTWAARLGGAPGELLLGSPSGIEYPVNAGRLIRRIVRTGRVLVLMSEEVAAAELYRTGSFAPVATARAAGRFYAGWAAVDTTPAPADPPSGIDTETHPGLTRAERVAVGGDVRAEVAAVFCDDPDVDLHGVDGSRDTRPPHRPALLVELVQAITVTDPVTGVTLRYEFQAERAIGWAWTASPTPPCFAVRPGTGGWSVTAVRSSCSSRTGRLSRSACCGRSPMAGRRLWPRPGRSSWCSGRCSGCAHPSPAHRSRRRPAYGNCSTHGRRGPRPGRW